MKTLITVGLGYGDEGKGTIVDSLARTHGAALVVRYNGGAQAAHNVVTDDGRHHCFHQFGSGTFAGAKTFLSKHVLINPLVMLTEAVELERLGVPNPMRLMNIDERALITTPYHRAMNRLREFSRKQGCHGSCGMGIGETMMDAIRRPNYALRAGDLLDEKKLKDRLWRCRNEMVAQTKQIPLEQADFEHPLVEKELSTFDFPFDELADRYIKFAEQAYILDRFQVFNHLIGPLIEQDKTVVFEGAQGVLLDENHGFHPYTTWATTTTANAREVVGEFKMEGSVTEVGITRAYMTRHGPGPLVTNHQGLRELLGPQDHNQTNDWQKDFRYGWLDLVALDYALRVNGTVDCLAVTHVDQLKHLDHWLVALEYYGCELKPHDDLMEQQRMTEALMSAEGNYQSEYYESGEVLNVMESKLHMPILLTSHGPKSGDKRNREILVELH